MKNDTKSLFGGEFIYLRYKKTVFDFRPTCFRNLFRWDAASGALCKDYNTMLDLNFKMDEGFWPHLLYIFILPAFFLAGALLYNPFDIIGFYSFGAHTPDFHLVIITCIILGCSIMTRISIHFILKKNEFKWWHYEVWCAAEMFVMSSFAALYTILSKETSESFFDVLPFCIKYIYLTLCYPYIISLLVLVIKVQRKELIRRENPGSHSLARFYDEHKRLKLSISPSSILFIKSELNYVKIHYLDGGKVKEFMLRASMKSLESVSNSRFLVRCQRSYFVNPEHVAVLRKDAEGFIYAEMNIPDVPAVPVSKQFYDSLSALL